MPAAALPILEIESALIAGLREHGRVVLSAPTGSGKSTQVPRMLRRHGLLDTGQVVVLQPRRLAARMLAKRVAEEEGVPLLVPVPAMLAKPRAGSPGRAAPLSAPGVL